MKVVDERVKLSADEAMALTPDGDHIHVFTNPSPDCLLGCDWPRAPLREAFEKHGAELSGEQATRANHGLCFHDGRRWLFVATKEPEARDDRR